MKDYIKEFTEAMSEELEKRFGPKIAAEVLHAIRLNSNKRMEENDDTKRT
ncbi:hypothetical protein IID22_03885 [Patescibacteria group bacterium]|nr:hypothetical protein [Patescibacteria group bacterium]